MGGSGSTNTSSLTSTVDVSGLDVCQYNYNFVGSLFASYGAQSELSLAVIYSANLSGLKITDFLLLNTIMCTLNYCSSQRNHCDC